MPMDINACGTGDTGNVNPPIWLFMLAAVVAVIAIIYKAQLSAEAAVHVAMISLGPILLMVWALDSLGNGCPDMSSSASQGATDTGGNIKQAVEGVGDGTIAGLSIAPPTLLVGGFVAVALLLLVAVYFVPDEEEESDTLLDFEGTSDAEIANAARKAADTIEIGTDPDNDVYRAWAEMATELDVDDPNTRTPTEIAEAAREAGVDEKDIEELSALFEEVRYSTADPTPEREQRAVEVLREIEAHFSKHTREKFK